MPTISVVVPVYRVEPYLRRCVDSILGQTFQDFELILVDDGSPDGCPAICDEYAAKDSRVVVIHQENGGLSAARNAGIDWAFANSNSQWISFIDSDDWVHTSYLERLLSAAVKNNVAVSICGYAKTKGEEPIIDKADFATQIWDPEDYYVEHNVNATIACGKLYKKECFEFARYPVGKLHEDEYTTYKILFSQRFIVEIKAKLYLYFQNDCSITGSAWNIKRLDALDAFAEQNAFFSSNGYSRAYDYSLYNYFLFACCQIENLDVAIAPNKKIIKKEIAKDLRKRFYRNKGLPPYPAEHKEWVLAKLFPISMGIYFRFQKIQQKLKRKGD